MSVKSADGTKTSLIGDSLHLGHTLIWGRAIRPLFTPLSVVPVVAPACSTAAVFPYLMHIW